MKRIPHISALMTAFPRHLGASATVGEARRFMRAHAIHHLPVSGAREGWAAVARLDDLPQDDDLPLEAVVEDVPCVDAAERADLVLEMMSREHAPVVVVTRQGRLAGIFTWTDACHHFARTLREPFMPPDGGDVA